MAAIVNQTKTKNGKVHTVTVSYNTSLEYFLRVKNILYTASCPHLISQYFSLDVRVRSLRSTICKYEHSQPIV